MKKLTLLFAFACLVCVCAQAKSVVFTLTDGTKVYYLLGGETNPKLRFQEGKMLVEADTYEFSNIKNFYISSEDDPNAIENVLSRQNVRVGGNMVVINSSSVKNVDVFAANGAKVSADIQRDGDVITVNLNGLPKGMYVVSVGQSSLKVMKR